jgi:hypothetical protein
MASNLTTADKAEIKSIVTDTMKSFGPIVPQADAEPQADVPTQVDTDPLMAHVDAKIAAIIDSLPTGNVILRGRRGSQMVNQSEESLNTISDLLKDRKNYRTRSNIR